MNMKKLNIILKYLRLLKIIGNFNYLYHIMRISTIFD